MTIGLGPDGALVIRGDVKELNKLIKLLRHACLYGDAVGMILQDDGTQEIRIYKEGLMF